MRQYTQAATIGGDIIMADDWNDEIGTIVAEINGQLDGNQMPSRFWESSAFAGVGARKSR